MSRAGVLVLALAGAAALAVAPACAQAPPVDNGTSVGGRVESTLELILKQPAGLATFKKAGIYTVSFRALATGTERLTQLGLADGDVASGAGLGHLSSGSKRLPDPLQARVGAAAFQPLDRAVDPLLMDWTGPIARKPATITLRQRVRAGSSATYHKVVLVTLSSETP
jgi:hypothetical protein